MHVLKYADMKFAHHHLHTEYSPQDAPVGLKKLVEYSKHLGYKTLTVTDHGTVSSWVKLQQYCKEKGIKPIFGLEGYFCPDRHLKTGGRINHHIVLLAKNNIGIKNIYRMSELSWKEGFYYSPRIDWDLLEKYHEGVICTSACVSGIIPETFLEHGLEAAIPVAQRYKDIFGRDFYMEVQYHCLEIERKAYAGVAQIAKRLGIPLLGTNDVHFLRKEDAGTQEAMMAVNTGRCLKDPNRMKHEQNQLYLKSPDEMVEVFGGRNRQAVVSALEIADQCTADLSSGKIQLPSIEVPKEYKSDMDYLEALSWKGLAERGKAGLKDYEDRLKEELQVIRDLREKKGLMFDRYFLVVWDYVNWAWTNGIRVGVGRGSGAGSLVLYCLKITGIDPIPYDLLFERFLAPDRNEMPDIDIDFEYERGAEVNEYLRRKYGDDRFARIGTVSTFHVASALKAAFKAFDPCGTFEKQQAAKEASEQQKKTSSVKGKRWEKNDGIKDETAFLANEITKLLPKDPNSGAPSAKCTLLEEVAKTKEDAIYVYDEVPEFREYKKKYPEVFAFAEQIEGLVKDRGVHAAGVLITEDPLVEVCPQQYSSRGSNPQLATAFDMGDVEKIGCIKFDILRTKVLSVITRAVRMIKARHGVTVDIDNLVPDDKKAIQVFKSADTLAIFQFESEGMRNLLRDMRPDCFEDVIAANALFRPGPIENAGLYCKRKHGEEKVVYPVEILAPLLKPTYGVMVYQEQVMKITRLLAGFDASEADKVRKGMGKKKKDIIDAMGEKFLKKVSELNTCTVPVAKDLWGQMEKFGSYAFNKSHSAGYAYTAYQCAYLKAYYPAEFMAAQLSVEGLDSKYDTVKMYEEGVRGMGIKILPPDINKAKSDYLVEGYGKDVAVRKGFKGIPGLGQQVYTDLEKGQPYKDMFDFCMRGGQGTKSDVVNSLVFEGAFDWIKPMLKKKLGRTDVGRDDIFREYEDMIKRAQAEKREKGARKEEKEGIGFAFKIDASSDGGTF
jgi:DNA polymerase III subunit alpha